LEEVDANLSPLLVYNTRIDLSTHPIRNSTARYKEICACRKLPTFLATGMESFENVSIAS